MSSYIFSLSDISIANNSNTVAVNNADSFFGTVEGSQLFIGSKLPVTIVSHDSINRTLTLSENWLQGDVINEPAKIVPLGAVSTLISAIDKNRSAYESFIENSKQSKNEIGSRLFLIAHRGFRDMFPQNTMLAMTSAIRRGADALECDVSYSADGTGYLFHDNTVNALTNGSGDFGTLSNSYINSLRFSALSGSIIDDVRIPTFESFVKYASEAGVTIYPEIKSINSNANIDNMLFILESYNMIDKAVLQSFRLSDLQYVRSVNSDIQIGYLGSSTSLSTYQAAVDEMAALGNGWLLWSNNALRSVPAIIDYAKSNGVQVGTWTVDDINDAKTLMRLGVRHIMSDINLETV